MDEPVVKQVSLFQNFRDTHPEKVSWEHVFRLIVSDRYKEATEKYRYFYSQHLDQDAARVKKTSPCLVPSVTCIGGRKRENAESYTSCCMADVDKLPEGVAERLLETVGSDPYVILAYVTISGRGLRIFYRTDVTEMKHHAFAFNQGNDHYAALLAYPTDRQCKDLTRASILNCCPMAYFNPDALSMPIHVSEVEKKKVGRPKLIRHASALEAAGVILPQLEVQGKTYSEGHYNAYVSSVMYLMNRYGVPFDEALSWASAKFPDYEYAGLESIARSVYQHTDEYGSYTLSGTAEKQGKNRYATVDELEHFISTQAHIRYNQILDRREICWNSEKSFHDITDQDENSLWTRAHKSGLFCSFRLFQSIINSEFIASYNPLTDYLENLPVWDGTTDYIARVAAMVHTTNDKAFAIHFRKWFTGVIASIMSPGRVNHTILVLIGKQGIYKTTFFNKLLPEHLQRYFHTKTNSGQMTKDDNISLSEFAIICIEEIDNMRSHELNQLKAMVTMTTVNERAAYDRNKKYKPHIASLCATGNNRLFLTDDTGNRRWLPSLVEQIDNLYTTSIPHDGLYAQALALYRSGFEYWFSDEEMKELSLQNCEFEEPNIEEELICSRFRLPKPGEAGIFMSTAEIMERIGSIIKYNLSKTKICRAMGKLGYQTIRRNSARGFRVILLTNDEISSNQYVMSPKESPLDF